MGLKTIYVLCGFCPHFIFDHLNSFQKKAVFLPQLSVRDTIQRRKKLQKCNNLALPCLDHD